MATKPAGTPPAKAPQSNPTGPTPPSKGAPGGNRAKPAGTPPAKAPRSMPTGATPSRK